MDESTAFAVRRLLAGGRIFETLDNSRLTRAVVTDDEGQGSVEGNRLPAATKRANALDG